jgi:hypothetical protein
MKSTTVHPFAKKTLMCRARKIYMDDTVLLHYNYARTLSLHIVYKTYWYIHVYALHVARVHVHVDLHVSLQKAGLLLHFAILQLIIYLSICGDGRRPERPASRLARLALADRRLSPLPSATDRSNNSSKGRESWPDRSACPRRRRGRPSSQSTTRPSSEFSAIFRSIGRSDRTVDFFR